MLPQGKLKETIGFEFEHKERNNQYYLQALFNKLKALLFKLSNSMKIAQVVEIFDRNVYIN